MCLLGSKRQFLNSLNLSEGCLLYVCQTHDIREISLGLVVFRHCLVSCLMLLRVRFPSAKKKYSTEAGIRISNIYLPQWNHQNPLNQHKSKDLMWKLATGSATSCCFCEPFHPCVSEVDSSIFESGQSSFSKSRILVKNQSSMTKQFRSWWDGSLWAVSSDSTLFAKPCIYPQGLILSMLDKKNQQMNTCIKTICPKK